MTILLFPLCRNTPFRRSFTLSKQTREIHTSGQVYGAAGVVSQGVRRGLSGAPLQGQQPPPPARAAALPSRASWMQRRGEPNHRPWGKESPWHRISCEQV